MTDSPYISRMMKSPSQIVWHLAGEPPPKKRDSWQPCQDVCTICGQPSELGDTVKNALSKSDTDGDAFAAQWSDWVCAGCCWSASGRPPDTLRLWSVAWADVPVFGQQDRQRFIDYMGEKVPAYEAKGKTIEVAHLTGAQGLCMTNKADLRPIVELLADPPGGPYFAALADTGQIHTLRFAQINYGDTWTVRFERADVTCHRLDWCDLVWHAGCLKLAGFREHEILSGQPSAYGLKTHGVDVWRHHSTPLQRWHRSDALAMALFCMTKDTTYDCTEIAQAVRRFAGRDTQDTRHRPGVDDAREHPQGERQPDQTLGLGAESTAGRGRPGANIRADGQRDGRAASDRRSTAQDHGQQSLFDW